MKAFPWQATWIKTMRRCNALILALALWPGCATTPRAETSELKSPQAERFDPRSLGEDQVLIQPEFDRPAVAELEKAGASVSSGPNPGAIQVYRVQIMSLSFEAKARQIAEELERTIGVPVLVEPERGLFMVRAGAFRSDAEAAILLQRLREMGPRYADSFVVVREQSIDPDKTGSSPLDLTSETPAAAGTVDGSAVSDSVLVPAFGWRVQIGQFKTHEEAARLKEKARRHLKRSDIDVIFKAPWYRVQVGHYRYEAEAREWAERLGARGYRTLRVRGQVFLPLERR